MNPIFNKSSQFDWLNQNTDSERWFFPNPPVLVTDLVFVPPDKAGVAIGAGMTIIAGAINPIAGAVVGLIIGIFGDKGSVPTLNVCGIQSIRSVDILTKYCDYFGFDYKYLLTQFSFKKKKVSRFGRDFNKLYCDNYFGQYFIDNILERDIPVIPFDINSFLNYVRYSKVYSVIQNKNSFGTGNIMDDSKVLLYEHICLIWFLNLCCQTKFNSFEEYVSKYHEIGIIDSQQVDNAFGQPVSAQPVDTVQDGLNNLLGNIDTFNMIKKYWYFLIIGLILIFKKK